MTKGLNIPIKGQPAGDIQEFIPSGQSHEKTKPKEIALNLSGFDNLRLQLLKKVGEKVKIGEAVCEDKDTPGRLFVSPAAGTIKDVRRGLKRRILDVIIEVDPNHEEFLDFQPLDPNNASAEQLKELLLKAGFFAKIKQRPFNILADPNKTPKSIFVKAVETAPFAVPAELQVKGHEPDFQRGLNALQKLTTGPVHLVYSAGSQCKAFTEAVNVERHTVTGPHPAGNVSIHIHNIDPITSADETIWTLSAEDVVAIGRLLRTGHYPIDRVISIAGPGVIEGQRGYFKIREGYPIAALVVGRIPKGPLRFISGDPLMGHKVAIEDFLGFDHNVFCVIPENTERELLHFFRLGTNKYTFSKAYLSGHFDNSKRQYDFTTNQHGEHRAFIDPTLYEKVMPINIPTMLLVKAVMAEDYELAEELGILEVAPEDFALATFVCPSKMEMTEIMKQGIRAYAIDMLQ